MYVPYVSMSRLHAAVNRARPENGFLPNLYWTLPSEGAWTAQPDYRKVR